MNRGFLSVWNAVLQSWVAVPETARTRGARSVRRLTLAPLLAATGGAFAACPADVPSGMTVAANNTCEATGASYSRAASTSSVFIASGANAVLNVTAANVSVTNTATANASHGVNAGGGGQIDFAGNATVTTSGLNGRGIYATGASVVRVRGNLVTANVVGHSGAGLQIDTGASLIVDGTTQTTTRSADGLRINGTATFNGGVSVDAARIVNSASFYGVLVTGTARFNAGLSVDFVNSFDSGATYGVNSSGTTSVTGDLDVNMQGASARGVTVAAGTTSVSGSSRIATDGASGHGVHVTGANATFESLGTANTISTQGNGAQGIFASGAGSLTAIGASTARTTGPAVALGQGSSVTTAGVGSHGIVVTAGAGQASVLLAGTVSVTGAGSHGIDASGVAGGVSIVNSGSVSSSAGLAIMGSGAADSVVSSAGLISGDVDLDVGNDSFLLSGGALAGAVRMGSGDDTFTASGSAQLQQAVQLDGGAGTDTLVLDGLFLRGFTAPANDATGNLAGGNNTNLTAWELIELRGGATLKLSGDLFVAAAPGQLQIGPSATLDLRGNSPGIFTIHGDVTNAGVMAMNDGTPDDVTTITGNYAGTGGATLRTDARWMNPNTFVTDRLVIQGNASGSTTVVVAGGILGDVVRADSEKIASVPVVQVAQAHAGNAFVGTAATTNAGEAQLRKIGNDYFWTLEAQATPTTTVPIIAAPVAGYLLGPVLAQEMAFSQIGTLHQRIGQQQAAGWTGCAGPCAETSAQAGAPATRSPVWGRMHAMRQELRGQDRFGAEGLSGFMQFGGDVSVDAGEDGSRRHLGVTATYGWGHFDNRDALRSQNGVVVADTFTGRTRADQVSLGSYGTWYAADGGYVDLVGQLSALRNQYTSRDGIRASHGGYGAGVSIEAGRPLRLAGSSWTLEPQAQLVYQYVSMRDMSDGVRSLQWSDRQGLRGRVGARLAWAGAERALPAAASSFYVSANLLRDFGDRIAQLDVGRDRIGERLERSWAEVGVGAQWVLRKSTYLYGDVRAQRSLDGSGRQGLASNVGIRTTW